MRKAITMLLLSLMSYPAASQIVGEDIQYQADGITMRGYLSYDDSIDGPRPGVLVVHEWWGHNQYARQRADMLAGLGYIALAVDMYGDGKLAGHPEQAGAFASAVRKNMPGARRRFLAAKSILESHTLARKSHIAAIGYCFGGGIVLEMARAGIELKGVVSFHGSLGTSTPAQKNKVKASILVLNGAADPFVKATSIETFTQEMQQAGVDFRFISYPDAKHAFTNPQATELGKKFGIPLAYQAEADKASWQEMQRFFNQVLH